MSDESHPKLKIYTDQEDKETIVCFWCPACNEPHPYRINSEGTGRPNWTFNHNMDAPTFSPSLRVLKGKLPDGRPRDCHLFLTNGLIDYCEDSYHAMAGRKGVPLPDFPPDY